MSEANLFTDIENEFIANLGIYACWLLKHGKAVGKDPKANRIVGTYVAYEKDTYRKDGFYAAILMNEIDYFCRDNDYEKPLHDYPTALSDLINYRRGLKPQVG